MGENENARMRVVVRIRPINQKELKNDEETILEQLDEKVWTFFSTIFLGKIFCKMKFFGIRSELRPDRLFPSPGNHLK